MSISQRVGRAWGKFKSRGSNPSGSMTLMEHLGEMRTRLVIAVLAVAGGAVIGWFLFDPVFSFLQKPYCEIIKANPKLAVSPNAGCKFFFNSAVSPFLIKIKVVTFIGLGIALPVVLYQLWRFITPGLTHNERRYAIPFVAASIALFGLGAYFGLFTLPKALNFLLGFAGSNTLVSALDVNKYMTFVFFMILAFGLSFELPVILVSLTAAGVLTSARLRKWRRGAMIGIAVFAALITPTQDWFTMTAMMVPLLIFYEMSILIARFVLKK
jgi:sec-independent protein translocase protein TatC